MFEFQKLQVYQKALIYNAKVKNIIRSSAIDKDSKDQLNRAAMSILLNLAEGSGRFSKADRRHFFVMSRSSVFECVGILDILLQEQLISDEIYLSLFEKSEELSKMIYAMIRNLGN